MLLKMCLCGQEAGGLKGGALIHIYKGRGGHSLCTSHRGIMLLSTRLNICTGPFDLASASISSAPHSHCTWGQLLSTRRFDSLLLQSSHQVFAGLNLAPGDLEEL